jgi:hypothetical protein
MHIVTDEAEPTAVETLAMDICELREDIDELRDRLGGSKPRSMAHIRKAAGAALGANACHRQGRGR